MSDTIIIENGEEIHVRELGWEQLGVRVRLFLGEDENGEYLGDPPTTSVDVCYYCYHNYIRGEEGNWIPNYTFDVEHIGRTFEEIFADGEVWEWDSECSEVFRYSGYKCDECQEVLLEGIWDVGDGKERPKIWLDEYNRPQKI